jgi:ubiquitin-protein ligase
MFVEAILSERSFAWLNVELRNGGMFVVTITYGILTSRIHLLCLQTHYADRWYELRIHCTDQYPAVPPQIKFVTKINMSCVDKHGVVLDKKLAVMRNWNRNMGIEQLLSGIRLEMTSDANRRLKQPADGTTY